MDTATNAPFEPARVKFAGTGRGYFVIRDTRGGYRERRVLAGPYTTREAAQGFADALNAPHDAPKEGQND